MDKESHGDGISIFVFIPSTSGIQSGADILFSFFFSSFFSFLFLSFFFSPTVSPRSRLGLAEVGRGVTMRRKTNFYRDTNRTDKTLVKVKKLRDCRVFQGRWRSIQLTARLRNHHPPGGPDFSTRFPLFFFARVIIGGGGEGYFKSVY